MPTLDDAPTIPALATADLLSSTAATSSTVASQDLIQIYDVSEQKVKTITVKALSDAIATTSLTATP